MKPQYILILWALLTAHAVTAQKEEVFKEKGYTLTFINLDKNFDPALKTRMIQTFFKVYPTLSETFNPATLRAVTFFIDTAYAGVAEAGNGRVRFSHAWFQKHPGDIDVVTHEVMHIIQAYPDEAGPWWITEGIADYVRSTYGVDNPGAGWTMPEFKTTQSYDNGYRITARFFTWIETHVKKGFIKTLDNAMRTKTYTPNIWKTQTNQTLEQLWQSYAQNPTI